MFKNYFKTAWRTLTKNKTTSVINVLGLSIGISASLIIFMIVHYNFSFDKFEPDSDRIYRIVTEEEGWNNPGVAVPLHTVLNKVAGIEHIVPILEFDDNAKVQMGNENNAEPKTFKAQNGIVFTNSDYFKVFPYSWIAGNQQNVLKTPYTAVLTQSRAELYFPGVASENIIGKRLALNDTINLTVAGVVDNLNANSDFSRKIFVSLQTASLGNLKDYFGWEQWGNTNSNFQTIIKLLPGTKPEKINTQLPPIFKAYDPDNSKPVRRLQSLSDIHTNPIFGGPGNPEIMRNLMILAVFLLLLGAINFINLSTAHASERAKEIGIRKTLGSRKKQIVTQFLTEIFLLTLFTSLLSIAITPLLLKAFEGFIPEGLHFRYLLQQPSIWIFLLLLSVLVSGLSGIYPAFVLTKFKPAIVLKGNIPLGNAFSGNVLLRKGLIVFQFVIAQVIVIGVIVVNKQVHYSLKTDLGFRTEAIINFFPPLDWFNPNNKKFVLKEALSKIPEIQNISLGSQTPSANGFVSNVISYKENDKDVKLPVNVRNGDTSFLSVYNIKLVAGRNVLPTDTASELLINETLSRQLGFKHPAQAIGHFVDFINAPKPIVGVMADFHLQSMRTAIDPLIYFSSPKDSYMMHVALQPDPATWKNAINKMEKAWKQVYPDEDFKYTFLDKTIENFYKEDQQLSKLLTWSAAVAVFISCLGLLGLVIFITNKRVKEIGIRKVLGASVAQIIALLSRDFIQLLVISFVIATPIAWWQTNKWLQNFAYHTSLSWWVFLLSGIIMITASLIILCIRAGRAAIANPVKSLRTE